MAAKKKKTKTAAKKKPVAKRATPAQKPKEPVRVETFPEGEEGIDLVCVTKPAKSSVGARLAMSPTGRFALAGDDKGGCRVVDVERGEMRLLGGAKEAVDAFGFLDNETAVVGDRTGQLRVVDMRSGTERVVVPGSKNMSLTALAVASGIAAFSIVRVGTCTWSEHAGKEMLDGARSHLTQVVIDDGIVYGAPSISDEDGTTEVHVWNAKSGKQLRVLKAPVAGRVTRLVVVARRVVAIVEDSDANPVVVCWDEAGNQTARVVLDDDSMVDFVTALDDSNGTRVAVGHYQKVTHVDVVSGAATSASLAPWRVTTAARGNMAVVCGEGENLGVYDLARRALLLERKTEAIYDAALAPDRVTIAAVDNQGVVSVYRAHPPR